MPATLSYFALSKARAFASVSPIRSGENSCITSLPQSASLSPSPAPEQATRSEEHTSELQSLRHLVCRLLLEKKNSRYHRKARHQFLRTGTPPASVISE